MNSRSSPKPARTCWSNSDSEYAANIELAEAPNLYPVRGEARQPAEVATGAAKCEDVAKLLGIPLEQTVKSIVLATEGDKGQVQIWLLMLRGDHELNEIKAGKLPGLAGFRFATESEIVEHFGCKPGYLGPVGTARPVRVVADRTVAHMADFVCGANKEHFHIQGVNWGRDLPEPSRSPTCATWSPATPRQTARARFPSCAASKSDTSSIWARSTPRPSRPRSWTRPASPPRWKWAATASA